MTNKNHIPDNSGQPLPDNSKKLLDYLQGKLSDGDAHDLERLADGNPLWTDALEGLQGADPEKLSSFHADINRQMLKRIGTLKTIRRRKKYLGLLPNLWLFVIIILLLILLAFWVVRSYS